MIEQGVARPNRVGRERSRELAHRAVDVLHEDLGLVSELAQDLAQECRLIGNRVAVGEVRQQLVDRASATTWRTRAALHRSTEFQRVLVPVDRFGPVSVFPRIGTAALAHRVERSSSRALNRGEHGSPTRRVRRRPSSARRLDGNARR
jgi:hypothetical protein